MKRYFKLEQHVFFNLHPRAKALNCHFQVLPRAKQNMACFNLLNLQEKILKSWYGKQYSYSVY